MKHTLAVLCFTVLLGISAAQAQRMFDSSGRQLGSVDAERYYDGSGRQIGRADGLRRMQIIIYFFFFM